MNEQNRRGRLDFRIEVVSSDDDSGILEFKLIPDPDRYEMKIVDGERYLYDKYDYIQISEKVLLDAMKKMNGSPIYFQPPLLEDLSKYISERIPSIYKELEEDFSKPEFADKSEEFLKSLEKDELGFVILSLDMVGSTKLSMELSPEKYARLISVYLFEISNMIPLFHGHILKYTGDGIIAYFPEPSFISKHDLAIECSIALLKLIKDGLNPLLEKHGLHKIGIRIGLDSGSAFIKTIGSPATKQHKDIIGSVVSIATKIQATASPGGINLGQAAFENLHVSWKSICREVELPKNWEYMISDEIPYKIFRVHQS